MNTLAFNTLLLVKHNSSEWHRMWSRLAKHRSNRALQDPAVADNDGEVWQYMETVEKRVLWFGKRYIHRFRHRYHPACGCAMTVNIPASRTFNPDDPDNALYHHFG